ncbi:MAG TPA: anhydro-N-acetylmuramic acid kinase [Clostridia bacterium]|nr:anhydro-N-acetylmuramic acid kinase [Clostridia bacterium]
MIVAGVMSGTSADGINVALVRLAGSGFRTRFELLAHEEFPYPGAVRRTVLSMMNATAASVADLARLNFLLAELYADAVLETQRRSATKCELVGCHGQTLYHQGEAESFLGRKLAVTWQTGEGAVLAARVGVPVVSDFRPADMAAGGKGAPLVPFLDYLLYRNATRGRIVQNIGGIGNLTAIPAGATAESVVAFDTGPGNMVIDAVMERLFDKRFDRDGKVAAKGQALQTVVSEALRDAFFRRRAPKTAGREQFGREYVELFLKRCGRARKEDVIATATLLTARSIGEAVRVLSDGERKFHDFLVSGGGAKNPTLMSMIGEELHRRGLKLRSTDELGLPAEAKEAVAFAVLAFETWNRRPSNVPSATGANRPAILGKISYV